MSKLLNLLGTKPNQIPTNSDLGRLAFQDFISTTDDTTTTTACYPLFTDPVNGTAVKTSSALLQYIPTTGRLGLGVTPLAKLHVRNGGILIDSLSPTGIGSSRNNGLALFTDLGFGAELHYGSSPQSAGWATAIYGRTADSIALRLGAYPANAAAQSSFAEYMTIYNTGFVTVKNGELGIGSAAVSTGDTRIELGDSRTGDGNAYIDFHSSTGTDYNLRLIRYAGVNGGASLTQFGTGDISITTEGASAVNFSTNNTLRATITSGGVFTALSIIGGTSLRESKVAVSASAIDLATGSYFSKTISGATTFTLSNVPASGTAVTFLLDLTNGGAATVTWWSGIKWASGTVPTLTAAGRDVLVFFTHDGGTTWTGVITKDVK